MLDDEPNIKQFLNNENILYNYLTKIKLSSNNRNFFTYKKLTDIEDTAKEYFLKITKNIKKLNFDGTVIDIGAHHGIFTIFAAARGFQVISYEPNPINFAILKKNLIENSDLNIELKNNAVSHESGILKFNMGKTSTTGALENSYRDWKRTDDNIEVHCSEINEILNHYDKIKILKIDCEGGEYEIFNSISEKNLNKIKILFIEVHPTKNFFPKDFEKLLFDRNMKYLKTPASHGCFEFIISNELK